MTPSSQDDLVARLLASLHTSRSDQLRELSRASHAELLRRGEATAGAAERAAAEANRFLDAIIENIPDMIFVKDAEQLAFQRFNRAGEELLGTPRSQLLGKTDYDFFPRDQAEFFQNKDRNVLAGKTGIDIPEEPIETSRGQRWLHTKKVPILDDEGIPRYLLGISEDITERKAQQAALVRAKEQAEAASRELEAFSYSVAHDLRAPLRAIDGFSQALFEDYGEQFDATGRDFLRRVREAAQQMAQLIDDLLALHRTTRRPLRREQVDLGALALACAQRQQQAEPDHAVALEIAPDLTAHADRRLLEIVLENLLGNARKFTRRTARPAIEIGQAQHGDERVYFVRDNGAGFDMAHADKLFGVFQRLHSEAEFSGTGIGLATVQRIVLRHHGRIWAVAEAGAGATFFFTLGGSGGGSDGSSEEPST